MQKKYYHILFLKVLKIFRKYFHFPKSKIWKFRFCLLEIWDIEIWNIEIWEIFSENGKYFKRQNRKFSDFSILENENIFWKFPKLLKIKFDNIFFAYRWNINLHHVIQSPAMNSARPVTIFRLFEFQLQQIFTHNEWNFPRTSAKSLPTAIAPRWVVKSFCKAADRFFRRPDRYIKRFGWSLANLRCLFQLPENLINPMGRSQLLEPPSRVKTWKRVR